MTKREPYNKPIPRFVKVDVLEKIRAEITQIRDSWEEDNYHDEADALTLALEIIDKYTGVSE